MISLPSAEKNASSGILNVSPGARSPGRGNRHRTLPCGSTISSRSFFLSAMRMGPGSTDGSEPGARCPEARAGPSHAAVRYGSWRAVGTELAGAEGRDRDVGDEEVSAFALPGVGV